MAEKLFSEQKPTFLIIDDDTPKRDMPNIWKRAMSQGRMIPINIMMPEQKNTILSEYDIMTIPPHIRKNIDYVVLFGDKKD